MKYKFLLPFLFLSAPALAQTVDNDQLMQRLDRMDHDIMLLQKQVSNAPAGSGGSAPIANPADLGVQLSDIQDQLRSLRGQIEENQYQVKKLSEDLDKLKKDTDFRFSQQTAGATAAAPAAPPPVDLGKQPPENPEAAKAPEAPAGPTTGGEGVLKLPEPGEEANLSTPRDHYNYAFRLLNQTQYDQAAASFDSFTKKYPKDPLVGNAYYWEGETYYIRRDYVTAADKFRQGFEARPEGPKAADNLLKLAMSLDALDRDKEACVVLSQVVTKFKKSSTSVTEKAESERKRIGCK